jgi:Flp pilus assembly protein TadG
MKTPRGKQTGNRESGAQLLELALVLPFLLVLIAGVADFAQAWNVRQVLANAARDGARLESSQPMNNLTDTDPVTIQKVCQQVASYLAGEHVDLAFMNMSATTISSACSSPGTVANPNGGVPLAFTYYSTTPTGTYGLKIEPAVQVPPAGLTCGPTVTCVSSTRVTLIYPFNWALGFNRVVNLISTSNYPTTISISVYSTTPNIANVE